ncbi:hypothetical protein B0H13DRAFT_2377463 [Mycena leptocephala]|nr:hypothetical protein B0H13DRAFT_2377463 [Mycena leptocephala]
MPPRAKETSSLPPITWTANEGSLTWQLIEELQKPMDFVVLFGKQDPKQNTSSDHKITYLTNWIPNDGPHHDTPEAAVNLWGQINKEWPYFSVLHKFLSTRPNIVPPVITTGTVNLSTTLTSILPFSGLSLPHPVLLQTNSMSLTIHEILNIPASRSLSADNLDIILLHSEPAGVGTGGSWLRSFLARLLHDILIGIIVVTIEWGNPSAPLVAFHPVPTLASLPRLLPHLSPPVYAWHIYQGHKRNTEHVLVIENLCLSVIDRCVVAVLHIYLAIITVVEVIDNRRVAAAVAVIPAFQNFCLLSFKHRRRRMTHIIVRVCA